MKNMIDIELILDETCIDPKVKILSKEKNKQVENIIQAIDRVSDMDFPYVVGYTGDEAIIISQRDIIRVYTYGRKIILKAEDGEYSLKNSLTVTEELLNPERFIRISQSEIINLYKVKRFNFDRVGTINIEFENGDTTWVSRSRVKAIKNLIKNERA